MPSPCQMTKCKPLAKRQQELYKTRITGKTPTIVSNDEKKATKVSLECSLKAENCLHEFKDNVNRMLKLAEQKALTNSNKDALERVRHIKTSLKKNLLKVDDYAWCFKFLYKINLY